MNSALVNMASCGFQLLSSASETRTIGYEALPQTSEGWIYAAMVRLMVRRLAC